MDMELLNEAQKQLDKLGNLGARVSFDFGDNGGIFIDAREKPAVIEILNDQESDCSITVKEEDFKKMMSGSLSPMMAFTLGKLKIKGSMGIAMKLSSLWD